MKYRDDPHPRVDWTGLVWTDHILSRAYYSSELKRVLIKPS